MKYTVLCFIAIFGLAAALPQKQERDDLLDSAPIPPPPFCPAQCLWSGVYDFPHFHDCNRYYRCIHGFFFDLECEYGESFDHRSLNCMNADDSRCVLEGQVTVPIEPDNQNY